MLSKHETISTATEGTGTRVTQASLLSFLQRLSPVLTTHFIAARSIGNHAHIRKHPCRMLMSQGETLALLPVAGLQGRRGGETTPEGEGRGWWHGTGIQLSTLPGSRASLPACAATPHLRRGSASPHGCSCPPMRLLLSRNSRQRSGSRLPRRGPTRQSLGSTASARRPSSRVPVAPETSWRSAQWIVPLALRLP